MWTFGLVLVGFAFCCVSSKDVYVFQNIVDCEFSEEDLFDMVYKVKLVFNQKLLCSYDSRMGKYVGYDAYGTINAEHYNNQSWKMKQRKEEVETICRANARRYIKSEVRKAPPPEMGRFVQSSSFQLIGQLSSAKYCNLIARLERDMEMFKDWTRKETLTCLLLIVPPVVAVRSNSKARFGQLTTLECHAFDFYPQAIVTWLLDGSEVTGHVVATEFMDNGDWSYQMHSYLELVPHKGVTVSCRVEHSGLKEPLIVLWDSTFLHTRSIKLAVGCSFFFIGLVVALSAVYWRYKKHHRGFTSLALH